MYAELLTGKEILEYRKRIEENDRFINNQYYNIRIDEDKIYAAQIIIYDVSEITSHYYEERIYEINEISKGTKDIIKNN